MIHEEFSNVEIWLIMIKLKTKKFEYFYSWFFIYDNKIIIKQFILDERWFNNVEIKIKKQTKRKNEKEF
jgi:hypothetical protein